MKQQLDDWTVVGAHVRWLRGGAAREWGNGRVDMLSNVGGRRWAGGTVGYIEQRAQWACRALGRRGGGEVGEAGGSADGTVNKWAGASGGALDGGAVGRCSGAARRPG